MNNALLFTVILLALVVFYLAMAVDKDRPVECACMFLVGIALLAFLAWFVLYGPTPDYLPPYGTGTQPMEMRD